MCCGNFWYSINIEDVMKEIKEGLNDKASQMKI